MQLYFYEEFFKVGAASPRSASLTYEAFWAFNKKAAYPQHFTTARACSAGPNWPPPTISTLLEFQERRRRILKEASPVISEAAHSREALDQDILHEPRLEFHKDANWPRLGRSIKILVQRLLSAQRHIPLTIYRNFIAISMPRTSSYFDEYRVLYVKISTGIFSKVKYRNSAAVN